MADNLLTPKQLASLPEAQRETYEWMIKKHKFPDKNEYNVLAAEIQGDTIIIATVGLCIGIEPDGTFN